MEKWLPVVGYEGSYEVSDAGRVRSLDRIERHTKRIPRHVTVVRRLKGRLLRPGMKGDGHVTVCLGRKSGSLQVHFLVLTAFVGPCPDGMECLHGNGIPDDNRLTNLSWGTRTQNLLDAVEHGDKLVGERQWNSKLKNSDIPTIRSLLGSVSYSELGRRYGVNEATIRQIKDGKAWKHIPQEKAA